MTRDRTGIAAAVEFLGELELMRNALVGFAIGAVVTIGLFVLLSMVLSNAEQSPSYYGGVALVLVTTVGGSITLAITVRRATKHGRER